MMYPHDLIQVIYFWGTCSVRDVYLSHYVSLGATNVCCCVVLVYSILRDVSFAHLARVVSARSLPYNVTYFSFCHE